MSGYFLNMDTGTDIFYHGSRDGITGKIKPCSRDNCDFGRGFYITRRYGVRVRNDGYGRFITLYDKYEYAEGTTFRDLCRKAQRGYIPKSIKSDDELIAYDNIRFPNQIHDSEEYEYEPFE